MSLNPLKALGLRRAPRRQPITRARLALEVLESRLAPSVNVLTFHNDTASTGLNAAELHRRTGGNPFFVTQLLAAPTGVCR